MSKKRKKKDKSQPPVISPTRYVREKGRAIPIGPCYSSKEKISNDLENGLFQMVVTRAKPSGKFLVGIYLVDVWCLGVKSTFYRQNLDQDELAELLDLIGSQESGPMVQVEYAWAHRLIFDSIDYADSLGIAPDKEFSVTRYILEPKETIEEEFGFEFGKDGKPFLVVGPYDNGPKLLNTLRRTVGEDNFTFLMPMDGFGM